MDILDSDKLILFVAFVIPGFVSLKTYDLMFPMPPKEASTLVVEAVTYSCLNFALMFFPIALVEGSRLPQDHPWGYAAFYGVVLFIAPVFWVCLYRWLRTTRLFQSMLPHPVSKPWDYVFGRRRPHWAIVHLADGTKVAGRYGSRSFASSAPAPQQIYLEETWLLNEDGGFERPRVDSAGVLVLSADIVSIELLHMLPGDPSDREEDVSRRLPALQEGLPAANPRQGQRGLSTSLKG